MADETGVVGDAAEPIVEPGPDAPPSRRRRRDRPSVWFKLAIAALLGVAFAAVAFLSQTAAGQGMVLDELLGRVRGSLAGELRVGGIRSQTLLAGFTLTDVALDAAGGVPVLQADSLVVRYSLLSLLVGTPRVRSATAHGLALEISRGREDETLNVERILAPGPGGDSTSAGAPAVLELGRISVRGGSVTVLTPSDSTTSVTVVGRDGTPMRRLAFENLDLDLEQTILRPGAAVEVDARLTSFASSIWIVEEPLVVQAAVGALTFGLEGIRIEEAAFRIPSALLEGNLGFGPAGPDGDWVFAADLRTDEWGDLADLRWIDPRIPEGNFVGAASLRTGEGLAVSLDDFAVRSGASAVTATGNVRFDDVMTLDQLVVTASPLFIEDFDPWVEGGVPIDGFVSGRATLSGTPRALHIDGRMTLVPTGVFGSATTADVTGTVFLGDDPGAEALELHFDPLNYRALEQYWAQAAMLGEGSGSLQINGRVDEGLLVVADLTHQGDSVVASRVFGEARFQRGASGVWATDVRANLAPLSLALVGRFRPDLELGGWASGPLRLLGPLDDLAFEGDFATAEGRVVARGSLNATSFGAAYALDLVADTVNLRALSARVPERSIVSGRVTMQGSGLALDSLEGIATVALRASRVGDLRIDSAASAVRATGGMLLVDSVELNLSGARASGNGTMGLTPATEGVATLEFALDSLGAFRSMVMGDSVLVRDGLSPLEEDLLRVRGIEPDTLPTALDVRMTGSARGTAELRGHIADIAVRLYVDALDLAYRHNQLDSARVVLSGSGLPDVSGDWLAEVRAFGLDWESRAFEQVDFEGTMSQRRGEGTLSIVRRMRERYFATGTFAVDSLGGEVALSDGSLQIEDLSWMLGRPARIRWDATTLQVDSLELRRLGEDPSRLTAQGTLARGGESSFRLDLEGFHVEDATRVFQREDLGTFGHVDLSLTVLGPAENPRLDAFFQVREPRFGALALERLSGSVAYRDRTSEFRIDAWDGERSVLSASGTLPLDLALVDVERRALDVPMDVRVSAQSLPANIALAYFGTLEDVAGSVDADLRIEGTSREPRPSGTVTMTNGAWTITALGVRHTGLSGELELRPDRTVEVQFGTSTGGRSTVAGTVTMVPLTNPTLDLQVTLDRFQAVSRRDITTILSGSFNVTGEYRLPVAEGALRVEEGTLFVDEFARNAAVVDLRDPTLFADGFAVDTTVFVTQPILADLRNPFLDNLRVDIDLSVPRNLWLRSTEMNVEMGGDLLVRYDRAVGDLVMVGDLQALRGSYQVLGRTFEVDGGTVSFLGQPGVNPALGIQALSRVRRREGDRLEIRATVTGTLVQPLVTLSSTEQGISQSDLMSYLLLGVPGGEIGTQGALAGGVTGTVIAGAGAVGNQLGTAIAQGIGFDYFAISQGDVLGNQNYLETAQFELGRYFGDDVFVVLLLSCDASGSNTTECGGTNILRGARVELALTEEWFVEGFYEDRLLRGSGALAQTGLSGRIVGVLFFRDWGYGSQ